MDHDLLGEVLLDEFADNVVLDVAQV